MIFFVVVFLVTFQIYFIHLLSLNLDIYYMKETREEIKKSYITNFFLSFSLRVLRYIMIFIILYSETWQKKKTFF